MFFSFNRCDTYQSQCLSCYRKTIAYTSYRFDWMLTKSINLNATPFFECDNLSVLRIVLWRQHKHLKPKLMFQFLFSLHVHRELMSHSTQLVQLHASKSHCEKILMHRTKWKTWPDAKKDIKHAKQFILVIVSVCVCVLLCNMLVARVQWWTVAVDAWKKIATAAR